MHSEPTPLQQKLERISSFTDKLGLYASLLIFTALVMNHIVKRILNGESIYTVETVQTVLDSLVIATAILFVTNSEELPSVVTVSLAYSVNIMKQENNLVHRLEAAETMG